MGWTPETVRQAANDRFRDVERSINRRFKASGRTHADFKEQIEGRIERIENRLLADERDQSAGVGKSRGVGMIGLIVAGVIAAVGNFVTLLAVVFHLYKG